MGQLTHNFLVRFHDRCNFAFTRVPPMSSMIKEYCWLLSSVFRMSSVIQILLSDNSSTFASSLITDVLEINKSVDTGQKASSWLHVFSQLRESGDRLHENKMKYNGERRDCLIVRHTTQSAHIFLLAKLSFAEHFAGANLVVFEEAVGGNCEELTKLTLLLLYIALFTNAKLRSHLVNSTVLDQSTQSRVS